MQQYFRQHKFFTCFLLKTSDIISVLDRDIEPELELPRIADRTLLCLKAESPHAYLSFVETFSF
jgi:hypothetical protein